MNHDDAVKDQVRFANDIVDVIGEVVPLKKSGRNFKACCPFHQEKTPSFMVHPEKQIFHCFGCGAGGDVFAFLMKYENLTFPEALRRLAERAHIDLPKNFSRRDEANSTEQEQLYSMYEQAAAYYHQLFLSPKGLRAREYFFKRGYDESIASEFRIGWSEEGWQGLFEFLSRKGFSESLMLKSSLMNRSARGNLYDVFRGRLLFPIMNLQGKIVAFGGRILTETKDGPKYLNSPENPVFYKRRELFGLCLAKRHIPQDRSQMIVTEGYFDFLRLYQQGFKNVVATLGTSLTEDHVRVLKRFVDEAVVIYDGDKAGQAASLRGLEVFLEGEMSVKLVRLPDGVDPDDYLMKIGCENFQKVIDQAQDFFDYKLETLLQKHNRWDSAGLVRITKEMLETLAKVKHPVLLDRYLIKLASALGVQHESLRAELFKHKKKYEKSGSLISPPVSQSIEKSSSRGILEHFREEVLLMNLLMEDVHLRMDHLEDLEESDFTDPDFKSILGQLKAERLSGENRTWVQWLDQVRDPLLKEGLMQSANMDWTEEDRRKAFADCLSLIRKKDKKRRLEEIRQRMIQAERQGDGTLLMEMTLKYQEILKES